jgi:hypothetical protein
LGASLLTLFVSLAVSSLHIFYLITLKWSSLKEQASKFIGFAPGINLKIQD